MASAGGESKDKKDRSLPRERGVHYLAALLTIIVGLGAIIGAVYGYLRGDDSDEPTPSEQTPTLMAAIDMALPSPPIGTSGPTATSNADSTVTATPTPTPSPTSTPEPTATTAPPTATHVAPTNTPPPTATTVPPTATHVQATGVGGVRMETVAAPLAEPGQGLLSLSFVGTESSINGLYVEVFSSKLDARQEPTTDERVASGHTDSGTVEFDLPPGEYVVLADLRGYSWGGLTTGDGMANVIVQEGHATNVVVRLGRLTVTAQTVDQVVSGQYMEVYTQTPDVNGNMVPKDRVASGHTDNTGSISFDLTQGDYIVLSNFQGYSWGDASGEEGESGIAVTAGEETLIEVPLGQISAAVRDADGNVADGVYLELFTQVPDASGKAALGDRVASGHTDNTGIWRADVTPGVYCIEIGGVQTCDLNVEAGLVIQLELDEP
jgi:hypothetical protein